MNVYITRLITISLTFLIGVCVVWLCLSQHKQSNLENVGAALPIKLHNELTFPITVFDLNSQTESQAKPLKTSSLNNNLSRRNPDKWFRLLIPKMMGKVERHADVDGGFYMSDEIEINYDYWTFENTPNWLSGKYATSLILACSEKSKNVSTLRTIIDGKKAIIQQCYEADENKGLRYIYYVTFPKTKVFNYSYFNYGMFNLTIEYQNKKYSSMANRIVHSIDFEK